MRCNRDKALARSPRGKCEIQGKVNDIGIGKRVVVRVTSRSRYDRHGTAGTQGQRDLAAVGKRELQGDVEQFALGEHLVQRLQQAAKVLGSIGRSEEHTSELQSLMRISYAVFCLKKKKVINSIAINSGTT